MAEADPLRTVVSTKGQVILPKAVRDLRHWRPGTRLIVENMPDGVLLRPEPVFAPSTIEQVFGCLPYEGAPRTLDDMKNGVAEEVRRRHARGRY